eukprot:INCI10411.1.p1 GENE.INCI10411.1~~INCI10411.1.p1  ORF type:complete len:237 (+),score=62.32 INCI10411.1:51-713(+)
MSETVGVTFCAACGAGDIEAVRNLIAGGADVEGDSAVDSPPLVVAAAAGHGDVVKELLQAGASVTGIDVRGVTALQAAVDGSHVEATEILLPRSVVSSDKDGNASVLHWAAKLGSVATVALLLKAKANPLQRDDDEETAADWARDASQSAIEAVLREAAEAETRQPAQADPEFSLPDFEEMVAGLGGAGAGGADLDEDLDSNGNEEGADVVGDSEPAGFE